MLDRSPALCSRVSDRVSLEPVETLFAEWTPTVDDRSGTTTARRWPAPLIKAAASSVEKAATEAPFWTVETLGASPAPDRTDDRAAWEERAPSVAAYREMVGHDDESDPRCQPPKPDQAETYAAWRFRVARPSVGPKPTAPEAEMSTGQLRVRIGAYERGKGLGTAPRREPARWNKGRPPTSTGTMPPFGRHRQSPSKPAVTSSTANTP